MLKDSLCRLQHHNQVGEDVADVVVYILRYFFFGKYLGFGAYGEHPRRKNPIDRIQIAVHGDFRTMGLLHLLLLEDEKG